MSELTHSPIENGGRFRPDGFTLFLAALSALGVALVLAREATYGVMIHWDSPTYIAVARNLLLGEGFSSIYGSPAPAPPLYPLLMAAAGLGVFDPFAVAGPLNAAIFGLTVFSVGQYARRRLESRFLVVWVCLAVVLSTSLAELASWALADSLFILLATLALIRIDTFMTGGRTSSLVWAAVFSALACQTRYIAVAVPVAVGLQILLQREASLPERARRLVVFSLIVAVPTGLWLLRNYLLIGELTDTRMAVHVSLPGMLEVVLDTLRSWVSFDLPLNQWLSFALLSPGNAAFALLGAAAGASIPALAGYALASDRRRRRTPFDWRPCYLFGGFALTYLALLTAAAMLGHLWHFQARHVPPLYVPLLLAVVFALDRLLGHSREKPRAGRLGSAMRRLPTVVLVAGLSLWMAGQVAPNAREIRLANIAPPDRFRGFNAPPWAHSETLRHIRENPVAGKVYSNGLGLAYLHNDGAATYHRLPRSRLAKYFVDAEGHAATGTGEEQLGRWLSHIGDGATVVWFNNRRGTFSYDYGAATMRVSPGMEPVAELADGAVFKVSKGYAPRSNPYRSAYASIVSGDFGEPIVGSTFDVYLTGDTLAYLKEPCAAEDVKAKFILHVYPSDAADLPAYRKQLRFDNRDFHFPDRGVILDGKCLGLVPLPEYGIDRIRTGQYVSGEGVVWKSVFTPNAG